jgi:hypothetical protein
MAGKQPFYVNGSNCKIIVNNVTLAYAIDISYEVAVAHQDAGVLGMYEPDSLEPISYIITGKFTVIRYIDSIVNQISKNGGITPKGASNLGNGIGSMVPNANSSANLGSRAFQAIKNAANNTGTLHTSLNPSMLGISTGFDIEVYQKVPGNVTSISASNIISGIPTGAYGAANIDSLGISRIRDCKITHVGAAISKRSVMTQTFSFMAIYLDEDSFLSSSSGSGQRIG